ncbi:RdgB/HAM1 family non-canonical purine NTP pyrophosphatase [[Clostridium] aminophilum]
MKDMNRIVFATGNKGKIREIREIMDGLGFEIVTMKEAGFDGDIEEGADSFAANSEIKAKAVWAKTGGVVLADDSGLVIDCLGGEPGVLSARYMEGHSYEEKNANLIERVNQAGGARTARFVADICAVLPDGSVEHTQKTMEGEIAEKPAGDGGFGYDPILYLPEYGKTSAEITEEEKNTISHRGKALRAMREILVKKLAK